MINARLEFEVICVHAGIPASPNNHTCLQTTHRNYESNLISTYFPIYVWESLFLSVPDRLLLGFARLFVESS